MMEEKNIWGERRQNNLHPPVRREPMYINIYKDRRTTFDKQGKGKQGQLQQHDTIRINLG